MTRKEFMTELAARLHRLPQEDLQAALQYYEEYFDEAGSQNEQAVIRELRSPAHVASKILSDYAVKEAKKSPRVYQKRLACFLVYHTGDLRSARRSTADYRIGSYHHSARICRICGCLCLAHCSRRNLYQRYRELVLRLSFRFIAFRQRIYSRRICATDLSRHQRLNCRYRNSY